MLPYLGKFLFGWEILFSFWVIDSQKHLFWGKFENSKKIKKTKIIFPKFLSLIKSQFWNFKCQSVFLEASHKTLNLHAFCYALGEIFGEIREISSRLSGNTAFCLFFQKSPQQFHPHQLRGSPSSSFGSKGSSDCLLHRLPCRLWHLVVLEDPASTDYISRIIAPFKMNSKPSISAKPR